MRSLYKTFIAVSLLIFCAPVFAAECLIIEYAVMGDDVGHRVIPIPREPNLAASYVTYTTSTASPTFQDTTAFVRIKCDAIAYYVFSTDGTNATALSARIPADVTIDLAVPTGMSYLVEFYDGSS